VFAVHVDIDDGGAAGGGSDDNDGCGCGSDDGVSSDDGAGGDDYINIIMMLVFDYGNTEDDFGDDDNNPDLSLKCRWILLVQDTSLNLCEIQIPVEFSSQDEW